MDVLWLGLRFGAGLVVLCVGAELFLRGAVRVARRFGVSPFVIGLTLVGFGTSAPELAVTLSAAFSGSSDLALGNVVGSNIGNIGLILAVAALVRPLQVRMTLLKREVPILLGVSALLFALALDGVVGHLDGAVLLGLFLAMTLFIVRTAKDTKEPVRAELAHASQEKEKPQPLGLSLLLLAVGLAGLVGGSELMVRAAAALARLWGLDEMLIGLTIVAVGTSLPELASSVAAAWRGDSDIAVGNVIGSNLFNILLIMGCAGALRPVPVPADALRFDLPLMLAFTVLLVPILWRGMKVSRTEGALLLAAYSAFLAWQILVAAA